MGSAHRVCILHRHTHTRVVNCLETKLREHSGLYRLVGRIRGHRVVRVQDGVYFGVVSLLLPDRLTAEHILTPSDTDGATLSSGCKSAAQMNGVCARVGKAAAGAHEDEKHAVLVAECNDRSLQPHAPERGSVSHARQVVRAGLCQPRGRTAAATRTSAGLAAIALIAATPPCGHSVRGFSPADELCAAADADAATGRHTQTAPRASAETTRPLSVCEMATHDGSACRT